MALLYQATVVSPRSTGGTSGPRFRCPSTRLPQAHHHSLCRSRRPSTLALQKLHRICQAEVRTLKARYTWPPSNSHSPSTATRSAPSTPITWSCAQEKCAPVSASAISRSNPKKPARSTSAWSPSATSLYLLCEEQHIDSLECRALASVSSKLGTNWLQLCGNTITKQSLRKRAQRRVSAALPYLGFAGRANRGARGS
jgi:hypothetical protein